MQIDEARIQPDPNFRIERTVNLVLRKAREMSRERTGHR
jgi:hypothetical protein